MNAAEQNRPDPPAPWLDRVPKELNVAFAGTATAVFSLLFAYLAGRRGGAVAAGEAVLAAAGLAVVFLSPRRVGSLLSLTVLAAFFALELVAGRALHSFGFDEILLAVTLVGALFSASYVRLGIRRRDGELAIAAQAINELTRGDRITERLSGRQDLTWLETEIARARRHNHQLALVLVQPDRFEELAAAGGDVPLEVLEAVAAVVGRELRATDVALRHGPSSFALVLPQTSAEGARVAAERIRLFVPLQAQGLTVSIGVATFPRDATTNDELIRVAERAMERAFELDGNRTVCASIETAPPGWTLAGSPG